MPVEALLALVASAAPLVAHSSCLRELVAEEDVGGLALVVRAESGPRVGQPQVVPQEVDEQLAVFDLDLNRLPIHMQIDG